MKICCLNLKHLFAALFTLFVLENYAQDIPKFRIDPSQAYGGKVSEYFESVEYIPMETTKESLFGDIGQLCVTLGSFVIADYDTRCVLFFDLNGKFIRKFKFKKNEFPNIFYDKKNGQIRILVYNSIKEHFTNTQYYSPDGQLQKIEHIEKPITSRNIQYPLNDNYFFELNSSAITNKSEISDSVKFLVRVFNEGNIYKSFLSVNSSDNMAFSRLAGSLMINKSQQTAPYYAAIPIENYIFQIQKDSIKKLCQLVFPQGRSYPPGVLQSKDFAYLDSLSKKYERDPDIITGLTNIFFREHKLFFKTMANMYYNRNRGSESKMQYNFIYDTATRKLVSLERIRPDSISFYLPTYSRLAAREGYIHNGDDFLYSTISSLKLFAAYNAGKTNDVHLPKELDNFFKTQDRKSNPVIVKMKLK